MQASTTHRRKGIFTTCHSTSIHAAAPISQYIQTSQVLVNVVHSDTSGSVVHGDTSGNGIVRYRATITASKQLVTNNHTHHHNWRCGLRMRRLTGIPMVGCEDHRRGLRLLCCFVCCAIGSVFHDGSSLGTSSVVPM